MDLRRSYNIKCAQKSRRIATEFSECIGTHSKAVVQHLLAQILRRVLGMFFEKEKSIQSIWTCIEIEGRTVINFGHVFQEYWHMVFKAFVLLGFSVQSWQNFSTKF
jgi:large-conductance mechanosensitive channel